MITDIASSFPKYSFPPVSAAYKIWFSVTKPETSLEGKTMKTTLVFTALILAINIINALPTERNDTETTQQQPLPLPIKDKEVKPEPEKKPEEEETAEEENQEVEPEEEEATLNENSEEDEEGSLTNLE